MKNLKICFVTIFGLFLFIACNKDDNNNDEIAKSTIDLYDKPLPVIKSYIEGKWELHYIKGGFIANYVQYYDNSFWEFKFNEEDRIKTINGPIQANNTITWNMGQDYFAGKTYIMGFYDEENVPINFVIDGIYNDTLRIHINAADAMFYYFTEN